MKQIIFLCLLSLTLCFSKPATPEVPATEKPATNIKLGTANNQPSGVPAETQIIPKQTAVEQPPNPANTDPAHGEQQKPATTTLPTTTTVATTKNGMPIINSNATTTETKPSTNTPKPEEQLPKNNSIKPDPALHPITEATKTPEARNTTETPKTPESPPKNEDKHVVQARGFDGPSFIGGIILSLGLLAIGFMGFKYYKNQTERNYHTL